MKIRKILFLIMILFSLCFTTNKTHVNAADNSANNEINPNLEDTNLNTNKEGPTIGPSGTEAHGTYYYHVEVTEDVMLEEIQQRINLEAFDEYDGDITSKIEVTDIDNYQTTVADLYPEERTLGEYQILYQVTDNSGNTAELTVIVVVEDKTNPYLKEESKTSYVVDIDNMNVTDEAVLENIKAYDDHDATDLIKEITSGSVETLDRTIDINQVITVKISDKSGNSITQDVTFVLKDYTAPTINLTSSSVTTSYFANASIESLVSSLNVEVTDNYDEVVEYVIKTDNYTQNKNTIGSYDASIEATDVSNNKTTKNLTINVTDEIPPVFYLDISKVFVNKDVVLTKEDFLSLLKVDGKIQNDDFEYYVLEDTYTDKANETGEYTYRCRLSYSEDNFDDFKFLVNVIKPNEVQNLNFFQSFIFNAKKIGDFVWNILKWPILRIKKLF